MKTAALAIDIRTRETHRTSFVHPGGLRAALALELLFYRSRGLRFRRTALPYVYKAWDADCDCVGIMRLV